MNKDKLNKEYYDYICSFVTNEDDRVNYSKLLKGLHQIIFYYVVDNDINRIADGIDLRADFADSKTRNTKEKLEIRKLLDGSCTCLEMLIALSRRIEETIMGDDKYGNRTSKWFWDMIKNLGLYELEDKTFNMDILFEKTRIFMDREYAKDGLGGLFRIEGCPNDLRKEPIWRQMTWYLNNIMENEEEN